MNAKSVDGSGSANNSKVDISLLENQGVDEFLQDLEVKVSLNGRCYITKNLTDSKFKNDDFSCFVELLVSQKLDETHKEKIYHKIQELKLSIGSEVEKKNILTQLAYIIRDLAGRWIFNSEKPIHQFEATIEKEAKAPIKMEEFIEAPKANSMEVKRTPIHELKYGIFNPFQIKYKGKSAKEQHDEIVVHINEFLAEYPDEKIALTYAANTGQAEDIYKGYKNNSAPKISGANQAKVFGLLAETINQKQWGDRVHILPIPTCDGGKISLLEDVDKSLENIKKHWNERFLVLGYQNEDCSSENPLAIGGGVSRSWTGSEQQLKLHAFIANAHQKPGEPIKKPISKSLRDKKKQIEIDLEKLAQENSSVTPRTTQIDKLEHKRINFLQVKYVNPLAVEHVDRQLKSRKTDEKEREDLKAQHDEIVDYIEKILVLGEDVKVGITYMTSTKQANIIYAHDYQSENPLNVIIDGKQAQVFSSLARTIKEKWGDRVHILPIPIIDYANTEVSGTNNPAKMEDVKKATENIKKYLEDENFYVIGLQNQDSNSSNPLAIRDAGLKSAWESTEQQLHLNTFVFEHLNSD